MGRDGGGLCRRDAVSRSGLAASPLSCGNAGKRLSFRTRRNTTFPPGAGKKTKADGRRRRHPDGRKKKERERKKRKGEKGGKRRDDRTDEGRGKADEGPAIEALPSGRGAGPTFLKPQKSGRDIHAGMRPAAARSLPKAPTRGRLRRDISAGKGFVRFNTVFFPLRRGPGEGPGRRTFCSSRNVFPEPFWKQIPGRTAEHAPAAVLPEKCRQPPLRLLSTKDSCRTGAVILSGRERLPVCGRQAAFSAQDERG